MSRASLAPANVRLSDGVLVLIYRDGSRLKREPDGRPNLAKNGAQATINQAVEGAGISVPAITRSEVRSPTNANPEPLVPTQFE